MHCLLGCIALSTPRVVIVLVVIFSDYIGRAYDNLIWPLLGFMFMPSTTLAYSWAINSRGAVDGIHLAVVIVAVLIDLGLLGGGARARRERERRK